MTESHRVIVLGLGGIGSAAAYWAARRLGGEVLGLEQFELGHGNGGSEDHSRIIRLSYHTPAYVELAKAAYAAWHDLEGDSGETVVLKTGGLDLAPADATIGLDDYRTSMTAAGVEFEELDADEVMARWPQWRLGEDVTALFQEESGIAMASVANAAHRRMAQAHGATLLATSEVTSISETDDGVVVTTNEGTYETDRLIVAAGAWTNRVTGHLGVTFPLEVTQEQVVYLTPGDPARFAPERFPIWIWMTEPSFYGFPVFGEPAIKVAWDRCELVTDPETREFEPRADVTDAIRAFTRAHLPGADHGVHWPRPVSTPSPRTGTSSSTVSPARSASSWRWAPVTPSSSPQCSARSWSTSPSTAPPVMTSPHSAPTGPSSPSRTRSAPTWFDRAGSAPVGGIPRAAQARNDRVKGAGGSSSRQRASRRAWSSGERPAA